MGRSAAVSTAERSNLAAVAFLGCGCDMGFHQHDRLLEFVAGPQCPVIEVAAWLTLFDKLARVKNSIIGLKPEVTVRLPAHLHAWTMPDEPRIALSRGNNQKSGDGIHSVSQTLAPLKDPIEGGSHTVRQCRFNVRVYVDEIDGAGTGGGDDAKIIALRKQGIERTESIRPRIVATGDVYLGAESWLQRNGRKSVTCLRCHSPCADICGSEASKLPKRFIIEIPARLRLSDGTRETRTDAVPYLLADASVECGCFSIEAKIVSIQSDALCQRSDAVDAPESDRMIRNVIEEARLVHVRPHGEAVNLPTADAGLYLESVKTQADIWALSHIDQATRAVFHLLSTGSKLDPVPITTRSDFEKCGLEIQFLFVDRPRAADTVGIQTAF